jgi:hypothetical protein
MRKKFCWSLPNYNVFVRPATAMMTVHMHHNPLRQEDIDYFSAYNERLITIGRMQHAAQQETRMNAYQRHQVRETNAADAAVFGIAKPTHLRRVEPELSDE